MKRVFIISFLSLMVISFSGCFNFGAIDEETEVTPEPEVMEDTMEDKVMEDKMEEKDEPVMEAMEDEGVKFAGELEDVSGGDASGTAKAEYVEGRYLMEAEFENLPELEDDFFYEGWIVRKDPLSVKSTGATYDKEEGVVANDFMSDNDYTDHDFYVLTLEPDDGDPAPAEHILEGTMKEL